MAIRDLGQIVTSIIKPDGTASSAIGGINSVISQGSAIVKTGLAAAGAITSLTGGTTPVQYDPTKPLASTPDLPSIVYNPLEQFASYTPVWTLACLTPEQYNNPQLYRSSPAALEHIVMSSAGRFDSQRTSTAAGTPEYFINNFYMKSVIGANKKTGNTNAVKFEWDIYEPFSMGLLLQSLQVAARNAGYLNYLNNTPFVLRLDFLGFNELGESYTSIKPKFFVLGVTNCKFTVNEGGSTYKMEAIPFNHKGFSDLVNVAYNDIKITAGDKGNVEELLMSGTESLVTVLNTIEENLVKEKKIQYPDKYEIQFPPTSDSFQSSDSIPGVKAATVTPGQATAQVIASTNTQAITAFTENEIGNASLGFDQSKGGNFPMKKNDKRDEKTGLIERGKMTIDPKKRVFQFAQGQTLTAIINQVILSSDYAKNAIDPKNVTPEGYIKWFRLDVQIELNEFDDWVGDYARKIIYRVVPFYVHQSIFTNPNSAPPYTELQKRICKGYQYIYSGQNVDILKFDIAINNMFFTGINPSSEKDSGAASDPNTSGGTSAKVNKETKTQKGNSAATQTSTPGRARLKRDPSLIGQRVKGGSNNKETEQQVALAFHNAFTQSNTEMVTTTIEILGDPYWIVDSGFANYFAAPLENKAQVTEDGTMNYESGDVYVYITFKTPVDINEERGMMEYQYDGKISPFSGIYRVNSCESKFSEGTFKQVLSCIRMPGQATDYADVPKEILQDIKSVVASAFPTSVTVDEAPKTSVTDETYTPDPSDENSYGEA